MNRSRNTFTAAAAATTLALLLTACGDDPASTGPEIDANDIIANAFIEQADSVVTTGSGLQYLKVEEGSGPEAEPGDSVVVHYRVQSVSGVELDNSFTEGDPIRFVLGFANLFRGFTEGVDLMREGETARLLLPNALTNGNGPLAFELELVEVHPATPTDPDNVIAEAFTERSGDVVTTDSGLQYLQVEAGTGEAAAAGDSVTVHYRGQFANGVEFDNSYNRDDPLDFVLGESGLIPGFSEGVALMQEGGKARLLLPSDIAYGVFGSQNGTILPNTTIYFDVELVNVDKEN